MVTKLLNFEWGYSHHGILISFVFAKAQNLFFLVTYQCCERALCINLLCHPTCRWYFWKCVFIPLFWWCLCCPDQQWRLQIPLSLKPQYKKDLDTSMCVQLKFPASYLYKGYGVEGSPYKCENFNWNYAHDTFYHF